MWRIIWMCSNAPCEPAPTNALIGVKSGALRKEVTPGEWEALKIGLRESYHRIKALIRDTPIWPNEQHIGGAIAILVHTAYHLGEIRQALCMIK